MTELSAAALRDAGLAFLGRIIAVHSHEVINAYSVINELAGLELDILGDAAKGDPVDLAELESVCEKIRLHVRRGEAATRSINWLAHSVDLPSAVLDINETLKKVTSVAEHWMRLQRARFVLDVPESGASLEARPFFFAFAVFLSIELVTPAASGEQTISIGYTDADGRLVFTIQNQSGEATVDEADPKLNTLRSLLLALGGDLSPRGSRESANRMVFTIPCDGPRERAKTDKKEAP